MSLRRIPLILLGLFLLLPSSAWAAASVPPNTTLALPQDQLITAAIACLVPLVTYVINHSAPWVSESVKAIVLVIAAGLTAGLYQAFDQGFEFNNTTGQLILTAIFSALAAHKLLWSPSTIAAKLGGGSNRQDAP